MPPSFDLNASAVLDVVGLAVAAAVLAVAVPIFTSMTVAFTLIRFADGNNLNSLLAAQRRFTFWSALVITAYFGVGAAFVPGVSWFVNAGGVVAAIAAGVYSWYALKPALPNVELVQQLRAVVFRSDAKAMIWRDADHDRSVKLTASGRSMARIQLLERQPIEPHGDGACSIETTVLLFKSHSKPVFDGVRFFGGMPTQEQRDHGRRASTTVAAQRHVSGSVMTAMLDTIRTGIPERI